MSMFNTQQFDKNNAARAVRKQNLGPKPATITLLASLVATVALVATLVSCQSQDIIMTKGKLILRGSGGRGNLILDTTPPATAPPAPMSANARHRLMMQMMALLSSPVSPHSHFPQSMMLDAQHHSSVQHPAMSGGHRHHHQYAAQQLHPSMMMAPMHMQPIVLEDHSAMHGAMPMSVAGHGIVVGDSHHHSPSEHHQQQHYEEHYESPNMLSHGEHHQQQHYEEHHSQHPQQQHQQPQHHQQQKQQHYEEHEQPQQQHQQSHIYAAQPTHYKPSHQSVGSDDDAAVDNQSQLQHMGADEHHEDSGAGEYELNAEHHSPGNYGGGGSESDFYQSAMMHKEGSNPALVYSNAQQAAPTFAYLPPQFQLAAAMSAAPVAFADPSQLLAIQLRAQLAKQQRQQTTGNQDKDGTSAQASSQTTTTNADSKQTTGQQTATTAKPEKSSFASNLLKLIRPKKKEAQQQQQQQTNQ